MELFVPLGGDIAPFFQMANTVGFAPKVIVDPNSTYYNKMTVDAVKNAQLPPLYTALGWFPFELAKQNPATQQLLDIFKKAGFEIKGNLSYLLTWNSWLVFAKAATACGSDLTVDCVLQKAGAEKAWTGGGLAGPVSLDPAQKLDNTCVVLMKITSSKGFVYDKKLTKPNSGVFNCSPKNIVKITPAS